MPMLDRPGRFRATPQAWTVRDSRASQLPQFVCEFLVDEYLDPQSGAWQDWRGIDARITAFVSLIMKNGDPNQVQIDSLVQAFGWDGTSFISLDESDWSQTQVQITVDREEYEGREKLRVMWINPADYDGAGVKKAEPGSIKAMDAKWGAKLRAAAPKKPVAATTVSAARRPASVAAPVAAPAPARAPAAPKPAPAAKPAAAPAATVTTTEAKRMAWKAILDECKGDTKAAGEEWQAILREMFPDKETDEQMTAEDWLKVKVEGPGKVVPF